MIVNGSQVMAFLDLDQFSLGLSLLWFKICYALISISQIFAYHAHFLYFPRAGGTAPVAQALAGASFRIFK